MLPYDFYQLSVQEVIWIRKGRAAKELNELQKLRFAVYTIVSPHLKKGISMEKFLPLEGDKKNIDKEIALSIYERYKQAGYLN